MLHKRIFSAALCVVVGLASLTSAQEDARQAVMENGKIFIIGEDGERTELDVSGARSIQIRQSNKMVDNNGEQKQEATGEAIIIGPDGEKTVVQLDGNGRIELPGIQGIAGRFPRLDPMNRLQILNGPLEQLQIVGPRGFEFNGPGVMQFNRGEVGKFMIGVNCSKVSDELRSHLQLEEGVGLIVRTVSPGSPSDEAGLQQHDILLFADDQQLSTTKDLTEVVEQAGDEKRPIMLTFIREGNEESAEVTPTERPEGNSNRSGINLQMPGNMGAFEFQQLGPGIILDNHDRNEQFDQMLEQLRNEMKQMREQMDRLNRMDK